MKIKYSHSFALAIAVMAISGNAALADPPARVGRLSYLEGTVSFHTAQDDNWSAASLNYPVTTGDALWTEPNAKTEVQVGEMEVRMDQGTEIDVVELDDKGTQIEVPQGVVNVHLHLVPQGGVQILTPVGAINLTQPGSYHIDSGHPNGDQPLNQVQATALEGQIEIQGPRSMLQVMPGETAVISGNPPAFALQEGNATAFDNWALSREQREVTKISAQYVPQTMTGYEDLDNYGGWGSDPTYGTVWYPTTVAADWAPYRYGHWAYVSPWGWTWVDDAPWGFAPFHYGRWVQIHQRWCWTPGEYIARPVYAPALVAFVGGNGWSLTLSSGPTSAIGWVPLAPREVFHPYYHTSVDYARRVNVAYVNKTVINKITVNNIHNDTVNHFANRDAATVIPAKTFTQGGGVHNARFSVDANQLAKAPVAPTIAELKPSANARAGGHALPPTARGDLPHAGVSQNVERAAESPHAPVNRIGTNTTAPLPAEVPHAPTVAELHRENVQRPQVATPTPQVAAPQITHEPTIIRGDSDHAPGPRIHHPNVEQPSVATPEVAAPSRPQVQMPTAQVQHPVQQTRMMPTTQGWQRQQHNEQRQEQKSQQPQVQQQQNQQQQQQNQQQQPQGQAQPNQRDWRR